MAKEVTGIIKLQIRGGAANPAPPTPIKVLKKLAQIKEHINSYGLSGDTAIFPKFLDHNSSINDKVTPNCPRKSVSHIITEAIKTPEAIKNILEFSARYLLKNAHNIIFKKGQYTNSRTLGQEHKNKYKCLNNIAYILLITKNIFYSVLAIVKNTSSKFDLPY